MPRLPLGGGEKPDRPFNLRCQICHHRIEPGRKLEFRDRLGGLFGGGVRRDRTDDLMLAKHALYQLSYGPIGKLVVEFGQALRRAKSGRPGQI